MFMEIICNGIRMYMFFVVSFYVSLRSDVRIVVVMSYYVSLVLSSVL